MRKKISYVSFSMADREKYLSVLKQLHGGSSASQTNNSEEKTEDRPENGENNTD